MRIQKIPGTAKYSSAAAERNMISGVVAPGNTVNDYCIVVVVIVSLLSLVSLIHDFGATVIKEVSVEMRLGSARGEETSCSTQTWRSEPDNNVPIRDSSLPT